MVYMALCDWCDLEFPLAGKPTDLNLMMCHTCMYAKLAKLCREAGIDLGEFLDAD